jgi:hypothetical protein
VQAANYSVTLVLASAPATIGDKSKTDKTGINPPALPRFSVRIIVVKLAGKLLKRAVAMVNQSVVRYAFKMVAGMVLLLGSVGCEFDVNVEVDSEESAAEFLTRVEQEMLELG